MIRRKTFMHLILLLFIFPLLSFTGQDKKSPKDLSPTYRKWLEEEVVYIITPKEKEVFLQLETDRERELFIQGFWKIRDPNPNTPENEFKEEHYNRIKYANQYFGREEPGAGWRSAMGRIYIILGEPGYVERFENMTEVYPIVIWSYSARPELGLHQAFNVVFFKRDGMGEYELYSPVRFGPQQLLVHFKGDPSDYMAAYRELLAVEPTLAYTSLTLLPGERTYATSPSIASEILINATIPSAPHKQVKDAWAEKLLAYKDIVEVEYSANYIDSYSYVRVIEDQSGIHFVHYLIEPSRLTFEQYGGRFLTNLEINGKVSDLEGNTVFQYEKTIPIEFDQDRMDSIRNKLFSFQDMFPLIEGDYKLNVLLKNTVSKEFTSIETDISIPKSSDVLRMSLLILANKALTNSEYRGKSKPFLLRDTQLIPSPRNDFTQQDHLYLYFQVHGLTKDLKESGALEYTILTTDKTVQSFRKEIKNYSHAPDFFEDISLSGLASTYYEIKASLLDKDQKEILYEKANFYISHASSLPRPWLLSLPLSSSEDPTYSNILGNQYLNTKDPFSARRLLETAYRRNPESAKFALDFCRSLFDLKDYQKVKEIAQSFLDRPERHEFYAILGQSCQMLGELAEAISYYKSYLAYFGTHIQILNSVGDCYYQLGDKEEALTAWERSLELNPNQENLRNLVNSIKQKK
ncbi:MAG: GWxTD domain-containing protein [Candidatus Aminicenantes bacterium]|nr:GWxTD domain-containing protein [Candidatus Aminicenantes bacterium]MDH5742025.1 GWxTD domain-containing protein [Candidatus Aminicenantes bacterium]